MHRESIDSRPVARAPVPPKAASGESASNRGPVLLAGCVVVAVAVLVATWWLIGPLDEPDGWLYILRPPNFPGHLEPAVGIAALGVVGLASLWVIIGHRNGRLPRGWTTVAVLFAVAGFMSAGILRVVTAASYGANIGGGMLILFGSPFVAVTLAAAILKSVRLLRSAPRRSR